MRELCIVSHRDKAFEMQMCFLRMVVSGVHKKLWHFLILNKFKVSSKKTSASALVLFFCFTL